MIGNQQPNYIRICDCTNVTHTHTWTWSGVGGEWGQRVKTKRSGNYSCHASIHSPTNRLFFSLRNPYSSSSSSKALWRWTYFEYNHLWCCDEGVGGVVAPSSFSRSMNQCTFLIVLIQFEILLIDISHSTHRALLTLSTSISSIVCALVAGAPSSPFSFTKSFNTQLSEWVNWLTDFVPIINAHAAKKFSHCFSPWILRYFSHSLLSHRRSTTSPPPLVWLISGRIEYEISFYVSLLFIDT